MPDEVTISAVALPGPRGAFDVNLRGGRVATIRPAKPAGEPGWLALPGLVNLHAHADRAFTVQSFRPTVHPFSPVVQSFRSTRAPFQRTVEGFLRAVQPFP